MESREPCSVEAARPACRRERLSSHTKDLAAGRIHGTVRDCKSGRNDYSQNVELEFTFDAGNTAKGNVPRLLLAVGHRPNLDQTP